MVRRLEDGVDAAQLLEEGGVLLMATDTVPGLHARVDRTAAVMRVAHIKGRTEAKPLLLLAPSVTNALSVTVGLTDRQRVYAESCWPGPFSLVLPAASGLPPEVTAGGTTVAVRVPQANRLGTLLAAVGVPVVSTSCNRAGEPPAVTLEEAVARFGGEVDGVFDPGDPPRVLPALPSALVDLTVWPPRLLRAGPEDPPPAAPDDLDLPPGPP